MFCSCMPHYRGSGNEWRRENNQDSHTSLECIEGGNVTTSLDTY